MSLHRRAMLRHMGVGVLCTVPMFVPRRPVLAEVPHEATAPVPPKPDLPPPVVEHTALPVVHPKHAPLSSAGPADHQRALRTLATSGPRHDLAFTMWAEARGFGELGMRAIGHVILNRVKVDSKFFGHGVSGVCKQHKQFSCWNSGDPNHKRLLELATEDHSNADWKAWVTADRLAAKLLAGADPDNTAGSVFFHNLHVSPPWRHDMILVGVMFGHVFYKTKKHHTSHHKHKHHHTVH